MLIRPVIRNLVRSVMRPAMQRGRSCSSPINLFVAGEQGAWYDPSDLSTLFQDSAGTTPVTAVEQPVGKILDKSGRGNHATQATAAKRPVLKQDANGKYYLLFDGVDDALATGSIDFTATDKMTVVAGVRKLSDAAVGMIVELSASESGNSGTFNTYAPGASYYAGFSSGSARNGRRFDTYAAPITNVIAESLTTSAVGSSGAVQARINTSVNSGGSLVTNVSTGNYGNYPLYIGSRGGTSLPFNGHLYSLIIRGAQSTNAQIASAETYVNSKTGAY